jgi:hypothetical protein
MSRSYIRLPVLCAQHTNADVAGTALDSPARAPLRSAAAQQFSLVMWTTSRRFDGEGRLVEVLLRVASGREFVLHRVCICVPLTADQLYNLCFRGAGVPVFDLLACACR